jgi:prolyl-tRNA synthetase
MVGALIMVHGDDKGLKIPPKIAPIQAVIIPINPKKEKSKEFASFVTTVNEKLSNMGVRTHIDDLDESPGFKFNKWELKGVPVRIEIGIREFENMELTLCRRDNSEKYQIEVDKIDDIQSTLDHIQDGLFNDAKTFMDDNICTVNSFEEFTDTLSQDNKFIKAYWDGTDETELKIKEKTKATIRCIIEDNEDSSNKCIFSGQAAKHLVVFAKAY